MRVNMLIQMILVWTVAMVGLVGFVSTAQAQDLKVEVRTIAASKGGDKVDSSLSDIQSTLNVTFAGYTSFRQLSVDNVVLTQGKSKDVTLPNGADVTLTFNGHAGKLVKLGLSIAGKMSTTLRVSSGSTFFQAGMRHKDGILILAIKVE